MADIFCHGCGNIYDSHTRACPRCERCPKCGRRQREGEQKCPGCGHPAEPDALAALEKRLDPTHAKNQRSVRWLEDEWQNAKTMSRFHFGKLVAVFLPLFLVWLAFYVGFMKLLGWHSSWTVGLGNLVFFLFFFRLLPRLVQRGWFRWLLREG